MKIKKKKPVRKDEKKLTQSDMKKVAGGVTKKKATKRKATKRKTTY